MRLEYTWIEGRNYWEMCQENRNWVILIKR